MVLLKSNASKQRERNVQAEMLSMIRWSLVISLAAIYILFAFFPFKGKSNLNEEKNTISIKPQQNLNQENNPLLNIDLASIVNAGKEFVEENCDLGAEKWKGKGWQRRAPAFLLIGAKKCGTTSLSFYLGQHPNIAVARTKELLFFIPGRFPHWQEPNDYDSKVLVDAARRNMYAKDYPTKSIQGNQSLISFEATPDYLLYSKYSAKAILCTAPWVKILVILRNPVARTFSHYSFLSDEKLMRSSKAVPLKQSFESWIHEDMLRLREYGVIPPANESDGFFGSQRERDAWREYQKVPIGRAFDRPLARSFYAIQLEEWFEALRSIGRDPKSSVLIVQEEELKAKPVQVGNTIFEWLGIQPFDIASERQRMVTKYSSKLSFKTRKMLEDFYYPHNQRLYKLLGKEWQGIWDWNGEDDNATNAEMNRKGSGTPNAFVSDKQESFLGKYCDLGNETSWWIKDGDQNSWRKRAPYFLLIGAKKAGTSSLWALLNQHPSIRHGGMKELHSFQPNGYFSQWKNISDVGSRVRIDIARQQIYSQHYKAPIIKNDPRIVSFDATPDYLLYSNLASHAILCTVPWVKLLVSLRNPIDRLFSNYNFLMDDILMPEFYIKQRNNVSFEEWVDIEMNQLAKFGVIQNDIPQEEFFGSLQEKNAWQSYQRLRNIGDHPIARSLYALQLEEWFAWLREAGRDPSEILFIHEEDLKKDSNKVFDRIVEWLDLPPHTFESAKDVMVTHYTTKTMNPETRKRLEAFFDPYNKRFYKLMGPSWEGIWDPPTDGADDS